MNHDHPAHHPVDPDGESSTTTGLGPDDVAVGTDDLSVIVEAPRPEVRLAWTDDLRAMSERLRRVEEELDGVFETIGRLLRSGDVSGQEGRRLAAEVARLGEIRTRAKELGRGADAEGERPRS